MINLIIPPSKRLRTFLGNLRAGNDVESAARASDMSEEEARIHAIAEARGDYSEIVPIEPILSIDGDTIRIRFLSEAEMINPQQDELRDAIGNAIARAYRQPDGHVSVDLDEVSDVLIECLGLTLAPRHASLSRLFGEHSGRLDHVRDRIADAIRDQQAEPGEVNRLAAFLGDPAACREMPGYHEEDEEPDECSSDRLTAIHDGRVDVATIRQAPAIGTPEEWLESAISYLKVARGDGPSMTVAVSAVDLVLMRLEELEYGGQRLDHILTAGDEE